METKIIQMIGEINPYEDINAATRLIEEGILDSLSLVLLINMMESEFSVVLPEDDLRPELFSTVRDIVAMLEKLKGRQGVAGNEAEFI